MRACWLERPLSNHTECGHRQTLVGANSQGVCLQLRLGSSEVGVWVNILPAGPQSDVPRHRQGSPGARLASCLRVPLLPQVSASSTPPLSLPLPSELPRVLSAASFL